MLSHLICSQITKFDDNILFQKIAPTAPPINVETAQYSLLHYVIRQKRIQVRILQIKLPSWHKKVTKSG